MSSRPLPTEPRLDAAADPRADPRWQLVERIIASPSFAKSERLSSFLYCVCDLTRRGQQEQINEQYIGTTVFGRRADYDASADSIVRSHASRLRHRLDQYFAEEGIGEEWTLTIPKGSYLPVFQLRQGSEDTLVQEDVQEAPVPRERSDHKDSVQAAPRLEVEQAVTADGLAAQKARRLVHLLSVALVLVTLIAVGSVVTLLWSRRSKDEASPSTRESQRLFWSHLFNSRDQTLVVNADSGLVMLQGLTKQRVTLPAYLNGSYLEAVPTSSISSGQMRDLATRRYTSAVDLTIMSKIFRLNGVDLDNTRFVYSRDIRPRDIKQGNLILLGTYESTPWVQLFEPGMNFYFQNDLPAHIFSVINRNPRPGEQRSYDSRPDDPDQLVYGVVAYLPTLDGARRVLILEGQSMAGTETAADFVFNDGYLLPFLRSIRRPDGTIPSFELLLRSRSMSGEASRLDILATRVADR